MIHAEIERIAVLETKVDSLDAKVTAMDLKLDTIYESILVNRGVDKAAARAVSVLVKITWVAVPIGLWIIGGQWRDLAHLFHVG